jgi:hypothetical protein
LISRVLPPKGLLEEIHLGEMPTTYQIPRFFSSFTFMPPAASSHKFDRPDACAVMM